MPGSEICTVDFPIHVTGGKLWEAVWLREWPPHSLGLVGALTLPKRGGGAGTASWSPARAPAQESPGGQGYECAPGPGHSPSKCIPARCAWKGESCFPRPGAKKEGQELLFSLGHVEFC